MSLLKSATDALAKSGLIDPTSNLRRARVWLFSGSKDKAVSRDVVEALQRYYGEYVSPGSVHLVADVGSGHAMVTSDYGSSATSPPRRSSTIATSMRRARCCSMYTVRCSRPPQAKAERCWPSTRKNSAAGVRMQ